MSPVVVSTAGVTGDEAADAGPDTQPLKADTVKVYGTPAARPPTIAVVAPVTTDGPGVAP